MQSLSPNGYRSRRGSPYRSQNYSPAEANSPGKLRGSRGNQGRRPPPRAALSRRDSAPAYYADNTKPHSYASSAGGFPSDEEDVDIKLRYRHPRYQNGVSDDQQQPEQYEGGSEMGSQRGSRSGSVSSHTDEDDVWVGSMPQAWIKTLPVSSGASEETKTVRFVPDTIGVKVFNVVVVAAHYIHVQRTRLRTTLAYPASHLIFATRILHHPKHH